MRKLVLMTLTPVAALSLASAALASDREPLMEIPEAAQDTIEEHVGEGTVHEIDRDIENEDVVYEVGYRTPEGDEFEIEVAADGELLSKESVDRWGPWNE